MAIVYDKQDCLINKTVYKEGDLIMGDRAKVSKGRRLASGEFPKEKAKAKRQDRKALWSCPQARNPIATMRY